METRLRVVKDRLPNATLVGVSLSFDDPGAGEWAVNADTPGSQEVFSNLVDNAIKYARKGRAEVSLARRGEKLLVTVADMSLDMEFEGGKRQFLSDYLMETNFRPRIARRKGPRSSAVLPSRAVDSRGRASGGDGLPNSSSRRHRSPRVTDSPSPRE